MLAENAVSCCTTAKAVYTYLSRSSGKLKDSKLFTGLATSMLLLESSGRGLLMTGGRASPGPSAYSSSVCAAYSDYSLDWFVLK